ncbi:unnamed protein product [Lathyrus sativus]|nr:unnamed protein product [Lathyrus sativus]
MAMKEECMLQLLNYYQLLIWTYTLEDKICDLYDIFVDGLDENAGPQIRNLYAELAKLWPFGYMDNHGIKHGICRAKERRRASYTKNKACLLQ